LVRKIFTFYINDVLLFKCSISRAKGKIGDLPKVTQQKTNRLLFVKVKARSDTRTALVTDRFDIQAMSSF